uniref:Uncharacterized protein LOC113797338 n=1 Tax=Dermatophagoides pteronyssinus TaxID=6956 RepID=A0A6P6YE18_DERPT|nr:uncharacterized protein LOC113797338 [Dermatophagoides pteronyssinus]
MIMIIKKEKIVHFSIKILPKIFIYFVCARYFVLHLCLLCAEFLHYETNVRIEYNRPINITFPAITICGCCLQKSFIDNDNLYDQIYHQEYTLLKNYSVIEVFDHFTYDASKLIPECYYVLDNKNNPQEQAINISGLPNFVMESIQQGRKCFTYFSYLSDYVNVDNDTDDYDSVASKSSSPLREIRNIIDNQKISHVQVVIRMNLFAMNTQELLDTDIIAGIHSPYTLPSLLETDFFRIDPGMIYSIQFKRLITELMPSPYRTNCHQYESKKVPRSQSECINRCVLKETLSLQPNQCLNYYSLITKSLLRQIESNQEKITGDDKVKFCPHRSYLDYYRFILARRKCRKICKRNCRESLYTTTMDISTIVDDDFNLNDEVVTKIFVKANHEMVQTVKHERQMSLFEFIGYLGGHAHIWLGLSLIQFYGAISRVIFRFRYYWEKFRVWYHDRQRNKPN